jgi:hypothetical protein
MERDMAPIPRRVDAATRPNADRPAVILGAVAQKLSFVAPA